MELSKIRATHKPRALIEWTLLQNKAYVLKNPLSLNCPRGLWMAMDVGIISAIFVLRQDLNDPSSSTPL